MRFEFATASRIIFGAGTISEVPTLAAQMGRRACVITGRTTGRAEPKKKAVEQIDKHVVGPVYEALQRYEDWRILVAPDHPTPIRSRAHSPEPVPFAMAGKGVSGILNADFSEANAAKSGFRIENGYELMEYFLKS